jgi:CubicO group peptidase (beta-lactamase class C family)
MAGGFGREGLAMRRKACGHLFFAIAAGLLLLSAVSGQMPASPLVGDYTGTLGRQHLVLHVRQDSAGTLACTVDLSAEHQYYESGLPCGEVVATAGSLHLAIPMLQGSYEGQLSSDGKTLTGSWTQREEPVAKEPVALIFARDEFAAAEKPSPVDGDWQGSVDGNLGRLQVVIHVKSDRSGKEYATLDLPKAPNGFGVPMKNVVLKGDLFSFDSGPDHFGGKLSADGKTIVGVLEQGADFPALTLTRRERASKLSVVDGDWTGVLETKEGVLHAQVRISSDDSDKENVDFSSPDQHARHMDGENAALNGSNFSFEVPSIHGSYAGTVTAGGEAIQGIWTQGQQWPLNLKRAPKGGVDDGPIQSDLPRPPLSLAELHAQMDVELRPMVENPAFAGMSGIGIAVGVYKQGEREVFAYGAAKPDSLFEIGEVTGTFTGLTLAKMVADGRVTLETPLRELLPSGLVAKPVGPELTLLSLATLHSGMQHMMDGFHPSDPANPLANFTEKNTHAYLAKAGVGLKPNVGYDLSDAAIAVLGEALADKAGKSYSELLQQEALEPLGLERTFLSVPAAEQKNVLMGHDFAGQPVRAWEFGALAPSDGLWSSAPDLLTYLAAQVEPPAGPLAQALSLQHELWAQTDDGTEHLFRIGLAWMFEPLPKNYFSLGQTGGFTSYVFFNKEQQVAGVVLFNRAGVRWAENVGYRIEGLLEGRRAYPLVQLR